MDSDDIALKVSPIHGTGVFAKRPFRKGEVVLKWENTRKLSSAEYEALPANEKKYIEIKDRVIFLIGEPERFVNHSCGANTIPGHLCDIATTDISAGEEMTTDYSQFYIPSGPFQCCCGSQNCRGLVEGLLS